MLRKFAVVPVAAVLFASAAHAETISISAMAFNRYNPVGGVLDPAATNGVLIPDAATLMFAPVQFPKSGHRVCKFSIVFQDSNNGEEVIATLFKKQFVAGSDALSAPQTMAIVSSSGLEGVMRRSTNTSVQFRKIDNSKNFYYVQLFMENFNTIPVGVQLDVRPDCP